MTSVKLSQTSFAVKNPIKMMTLLGLRCNPLCAYRHSSCVRVRVYRLFEYLLIIISFVLPTTY
ncbi:hypothetical protein BDV26DRAFT_259710 [Aspergillus bertholletiae]|uniref:Uncharacterized protein n=1 Tax=Aspergillus bertholletiae TaxID=1226010 RepID=A0A5N7BC88_9EURO|nr:hypothetical protein BDV26DRAFT_259710 [Aspergillus bertholletiae]